MSTTVKINPAEYVSAYLRYLKEDAELLDAPEIFAIGSNLEELSGARPDLEREFIAACKYHDDTFYQPELVGHHEEPWYRHPVSIARGEYPLELLPEYLRELAKRLYYP